MLQRHAPNLTIMDQNHALNPTIAWPCYHLFYAIGGPWMWQHDFPPAYVVKSSFEVKEGDHQWQVQLPDALQPPPSEPHSNFQSFWTTDIQEGLRQSKNICFYV